MNTDNNNSFGIENLPLELLEHIFTFLSTSDVKYASQTCQTWFLASQTQTLMKRSLLKFETISFVPTQIPMNIFLNSNRKFLNVSFVSVMFYNKHDDLFWEKFGEYIEDLKFKWCQINHKKFMNILNKVPNLRSLEIARCSSIFEGGNFLKFSDDDIIPKSLKNIKSLELTCNMKLNEIILNRIGTYIPHLESFICCEYFDESCMPFLKVQAKTLKYLTITDCFITNILNDKVPNIQDLKLKHLNLSYSYDLNTSHLIEFLKNQIDLTELNISCELENSELKTICSTLKNLEMLKINESQTLTDLGLIEIFKLKKLKRFHCINCPNVSENGLYEIFKNCNLNLLELFCEEISFTVSGMEKIAKNLPNLLVLNLTLETVDLSIFQPIFFYMLKLNIFDVTIIDDVDFTRVELCQEAMVDINIEILPDENKLQEPFHTIARLKNLRRLVLEVSKDIPGISIEELMHCTNLQDITFKSQEQVSPENLGKFLKNCPSLESIDFSHWINSIDDESIKIILSNTKRLNVLCVTGCHKVTKIGIDYLNAICSYRNFKAIF